MKYAEKTAVSSAKSKAEIEDCLLRYGATGFMSGTTADKAVIAFEAKGRRIKFVLPLPTVSFFKSYRIKGQHFDRTRTDAQAQAAYEQAVRQKWRALYLVIKAKLEAVESGISEFEDEFLANIVLPDGQTMGQYSRPAIARAYESGNMPPLLGYDG